MAMTIEISILSNLVFALNEDPKFHEFDDSEPQKDNAYNACNHASLNKIPPFFIKKSISFDRTIHNNNIQSWPPIGVFHRTCVKHPIYQFNLR